MLRTRFTELLGCEAPLQQAGMPGIATIELAAAVANAGGLGMVAATLETRESLARKLDDLGRATRGAFGVNFLVPFLDRSCVPLAAQLSRVVEFFWGEPEPELVECVHRGGALAGWQVGSVAEARAAVRAGCDLVIAQGVGAGGHVRGRTGLLSLLPRVLDAVDVPVLAAGGIGSGRVMAAALAAGADGVRVGTRFVAAEESGAHPAYVAALVAASAGDTVLTETFSVPWPDAPHRVLRSAVEAVRALEGEHVATVLAGTERVPVPRLSVVAPTRDTQGKIGAMALYAGESVDEVRAVEPAGEIVRELCEDAERRLRRALA